MKADFSRNSFDARKHYSAVLLQQGRVQVDADWNEQQQINGHRAAQVAADVIGAAGAPQAQPGMGLRFTADGTDLAIDSGRFYVDGLLCENDASESFAFTSTGDDQASLVLARPDDTPFTVGQWLSLATDPAAPAQQAVVVNVTRTASGAVLQLSQPVTRPAQVPAGSFSGTLRVFATYLAQPDLPLPDHATAANGAVPASLALADGVWLAYLDAWERHVDALDDPAIRETALGGPDTAARARTVWQVKLLAVAAAAGQILQADTAFPEWDALVAGTDGALAARTAPPQGPAGPCLVPAGGGYQGLENQLYRLEIHAGGADGTATFKWSRDNGSVVARVLDFNGASLTVDSTGRDDALGLANGQWVEIVGDVEALQGRPGQLLQIATVSPATATVTFATAPTPIAPELHPRLRRWDGAADAAVIPAGGGDWIDLEAGVQVRFTAGSYASGDYWLIPARSGAAASIEWPHAQAQAPQGIVHRYARLALVNWTGTAAGSGLIDCRSTFRALTDVPPALHVTGINWPNDDVLPLAQFQAGLAIALDGAPVAKVTVDTGGAGQPVVLSLLTANDSTFVVTVEMPVPVPNAPAGGSPPAMPAEVVLAGSPIAWNAETGSLTWTPSSAATTIVNSVTGGQVRVRVRLRGDFIWGDRDQQRLYLDGQARGRPGLSTSRPDTLRTDLELPSGAGQRSSDFESWFLLQLSDTPVSLRSFGFDVGMVVGAGGANALLQLANVARAAVGVTLTVATQPPIPVTVANAITVPVGQSSASVPIAFPAPNSSSLVTLAASVPAIPGSNLTTTLSATVMVVVVAVGVSPPSALLLMGATATFSASVTGVGFALPAGVSTAVTWSCSAGTIDGGGVYTAPNAAGTFSVRATSVADPTRSAQATVTVRTKGKDKDKDSVIDKGSLLHEKLIAVENVTGIGKLHDKVADKVSDAIHSVTSTVAPSLEAAPAVGATGLQAFIAPEERPHVGPVPIAADPAAAVTADPPAGGTAGRAKRKPRRG